MQLCAGTRWLGLLASSVTVVESNAVNPRLRCSLVLLPKKTTGSCLPVSQCLHISASGLDFCQPHHAASSHASPSRGPRTVPSVQQCGLTVYWPVAIRHSCFSGNLSACHQPALPTSTGKKLLPPVPALPDACKRGPHTSSFHSAHSADTGMSHGSTHLACCTAWHLQMGVPACLDLPATLTTCLPVGARASTGCWPTTSQFLGVR